MTYPCFVKHVEQRLEHGTPLSTVTVDQGVVEAVQTDDVAVICADAMDRLRWNLLQDFLQSVHLDSLHCLYLEHQCS